MDTFHKVVIGILVAIVVLSLVQAWAITAVSKTAVATGAAAPSVAEGLGNLPGMVGGC